MEMSVIKKADPIHCPAFENAGLVGLRSPILDPTSGRDAVCVILSHYFPVGIREPAQNVTLKSLLSRIR